ncbi:hypothetical protein DICVIV_10019 [Dictyocaulus viviparus]|uniref:Uncharacterized protein n=1 Tax=Dictyocaulus viviparus TaxID=29172 RepID=A0A0D8XH89_DICVI|nr:hypothetical protein DICVIV_10019 [Dictyocaulus viviparus]
MIFRLTLSIIFPINTVMSTFLWNQCRHCDEPITTEIRYPSYSICEERDTYISLPRYPSVTSCSTGTCGDCSSSRYITSNYPARFVIYPERVRSVVEPRISQDVVVDDYGDGYRNGENIYRAQSKRVSYRRPTTTLRVYGTRSQRHFDFQPVDIRQRRIQYSNKVNNLQDIARLIYARKVRGTKGFSPTWNLP